MVGRDGPEYGRREFLAVTASLVGISGQAGNSWGDTQFAENSSQNSMWNQWRGPTRDGVVSGNFRWPSSLAGGSIQEIWRAPMQPSYSGPIVAEGQVFVTETVDKKREVVSAFRLEDGRRNWQVDWEGAMSVPFFANSNGSWIRSTPAWHAGKLLVGGMRDVLVCIDALSGGEVWRHDFPSEQGSPLPSFGCVCSPLILGSHVYLQAGGGFAKLEIETGKIVWQSLADGGGMYGSAFSSPILATIAGVPQLIVQTRTSLAGVAQEDGAQLWVTEVPAFRGMNILTPTVVGDSIFTSSYGGGTFRFDVSRDDQGAFSVVERWKGKAQGYMSSPLYEQGHLYLHLRNQRLTCIDIETGKQTWSTTPFGKYWSSIRQGSKLLALDERGELILFEANPTKFTLLDRREVAGNTWAHIAISDDLLIVRDLESLIVLRWRDAA